MNTQKIYTLKNEQFGLMSDWTVVRPVEAPVPTLYDFKIKYGEMFYEPWHKDEKVVELVEKI